MILRRPDGRPWGPVGITPADGPGGGELTKTRRIKLAEKPGSALDFEPRPDGGDAEPAIAAHGPGTMPSARALIRRAVPRGDTVEPQCVVEDDRAHDDPGPASGRGGSNE